MCKTIMSHWRERLYPKRILIRKTTATLHGAAQVSERNRPRGETTNAYRQPSRQVILLYGRKYGRDALDG